MITVKELIDQIKNYPDDSEVFIRCCVNFTGNIINAKKAEKSTYGFFGKSLPCVIIEPDIGDESNGK